MHKEVNDKNVRQDYGKKNEKVKCINQIKENSVSATPTSIYHQTPGKVRVILGAA